MSFICLCRSETRDKFHQCSSKANNPHAVNKNPQTVRKEKKHGSSRTFLICSSSVGRQASLNLRLGVSSRKTHQRPLNFPHQLMLNGGVFIYICNMFIFMHKTLHSALWCVVEGVCGGSVDKDKTSEGYCCSQQDYLSQQIVITMETQQQRHLRGDPTQSSTQIHPGWKQL